MKRRDRQGGFTLIELLAVVVIIGILVGMLFSVQQKARAKAKRQKAAMEARELTKAWEAYFALYGTLPVGAGVMDGSMVNELAGSTLRHVKFMDFPQDAGTTGFLDPWGRPYKMSLSLSAVTNTWSFRTRVHIANGKAYSYE